MAGFTAWYNSIADFLFGKTSYVPPTTLYLGLSTTTIAAGGTGITEPSGGAYARVAMTNNKTTWGTASGGAVANAAEFSFPEATASWGTITYAFFSDAASGGNLVTFGALTSSRLVENTTTLTLGIGGCTISFVNS